MRALLYLSVHYFLECFVILIYFVFLFYAWLTSKSRLLTTSSRYSLLIIFEVLRFLKDKIISLMNTTSCLLFIKIESFEVLIISFMMGMVMDKGAWSDVSCHSR